MKKTILSLFVLMFAFNAHADPPANTWVAWQSVRDDGREEIYLSNADGSGFKRLTFEGAMRPRFAPDGRWISYKGTGSDEDKSFIVRPDGTGTKKVCDGFARFWLHDNRGVVCQNGRNFYLVDPDTETSKLYFSQDDFTALGANAFQPNGITPDGRYIVAGTDLYRPGFTGTNGSFKASFAAAIFDLEKRDDIYFFGDGCWPITPPEGYFVYHVCGNCPTKPDIYRMDIRDRDTRSSYEAEKSHPDVDWGHEYNPDISNDNKWLAYMTSTGCHSGYDCDYEIFLHELGSGVEERFRVTENPAFDGYPTVHIGDLWKGGSDPHLVLVPNRLHLSVHRGSVETRTIAVRNAAGGVLDTVEVIDSNPDSGITAEISGSGNEQEIKLSFTPVDLSEGEHKIILNIKSNSASNSELELPVYLNVLACADGGPCPPESDSPMTADLSIPEDMNVVKDAGVQGDQGSTMSGGGCTLAGNNSSSLFSILFILGAMMMSRKFRFLLNRFNLLAVLVVFVSAGCSDDSTDTNDAKVVYDTGIDGDTTAGSVQGFVIDEEGDGISGVEVVLVAADASTKNTYTAKDGSYSFTDIPQGDATLKATHDWYQESSESSLMIESGKRADLNLTLKIWPFMLDAADETLANSYNENFDWKKDKLTIVILQDSTRRALDNAIYYQNPALYRNTSTETTVNSSLTLTTFTGKFVIQSGNHTGVDVLLPSSIKDSLDETPLSSVEKTSFSVFRPMFNWLTTWDTSADKIVDLSAAKSAIEQQLWGGTSVRPQGLEKVFFHEGELWVELRFENFVETGVDITDSDQDGYKEVYGKIDPKLYSTELTEALKDSYSGVLHESKTMIDELNGALNDLYSSTAASVEEYIGRPYSLPNNLGTIQYPLIVLKHNASTEEVIQVLLLASNE